MLRSIN